MRRCDPVAWCLIGLLAGCQAPAPPVPASLSVDATAQGALVRYGSVTGYLVRNVDVAHEASAELWRATPTTKPRKRLPEHTG